MNKLDGIIHIIGFYGPKSYFYKFSLKKKGKKIHITPDGESINFVYFGAKST